MLNKIKKYLYKMCDKSDTQYVNKLCYYLNQVGGLKMDDMDSLMTYIRTLGTQQNTKTQGNYVVLLVGPPASGKSLSRKIGCDIVRMYEEKIYNTKYPDITTIEKSFFDTEVDALTYEIETEIKENDKMLIVIDLLISSLKKIIKEKGYDIDTLKNEDDKIKLVKQNINEIQSSSSKIYTKYRADKMSELLIYIAIFLKKNIYIESASINVTYYLNMLDNLGFYDYKPIIIYPFIKDVNILYERSIRRGLKEGRFLLCDAPSGGFSLKNMMLLAFQNYEKFKNSVVNKDYNFFYFIRYNADLDKNARDKVDKGDFSDIYNTNHLIEMHYRYALDNIVKEERTFNKKLNGDLKLVLDCKN